MKRFFCAVLALCLCLGLTACGGGSEKVTINVFNWGINIADGSEDYIDVIAEFEKTYPNIKVNYSTYATNEDLYTRLSTGGVSYDVIIPSDYMIGRLIDEGYLQELDFSNIPNFELVDETLKNQPYDPENKYSVPYTWGTVGIVYNTKHVDEADIGDWDILWNEKYAGRILMFNNPRDAFAIAQARLGYSFNTTDEAELRAAAALLTEQVPLVQRYAMDEIYEDMLSGEAWIGPYYAGDCLLMMQDNEDLDYFLPAGAFNTFIDAMCIPTCAKHKQEAELFINFLTSPEISAGNMDYIGYGSPVPAAREYMDEEIATSEIVYPSPEALTRGESFLTLPTETNQLMDTLFLDVVAKSNKVGG